MNLVVEEALRSSYRNVWQQYRRDDEIEVLTPNHDRLRRKLSQFCREFGRPITALEIGCGSGRYFHCLENVKLLIGCDISPEMLEAARQPVLSERVDVEDIQLLCENIYQSTFPRDTFDFIYSLGMFGNGAPVTEELCSRCHDWLTPGGVFFFNAVHQSAFDQQRVFRRRVRNWVYAWSPIFLKRKLEQRARRLPTFGLRNEDLRGIMRQGPFLNFEITNEDCRSPLWRGAHLECVARKSTVPPVASP